MSSCFMSLRKKLKCTLIFLLEKLILMSSNSWHFLSMLEWGGGSGCVLKTHVGMCYFLIYKKIPYLLLARVLFLIVVVFWVQICRTLAYIHNCIGICHCDIRPQNLLVRFFFLKKLVFVAQDLFCMWLLICMNAWYLSY